MKYRVLIRSLEDDTSNVLIVFSPIEPGTIIGWGTDSKFKTAYHRVLTCTAVPDNFN